MDGEDGGAADGDDGGATDGGNGGERDGDEGERAMVAGRAAGDHPPRPAPPKDCMRE